MTLSSERTFSGKIVPCLWFDDRADKAVEFYCSLFGNSHIMEEARYGKSAAQASGKPEGSVMTLIFNLEGQEFMALNGGPMFSFSPAVSFLVASSTFEEVDALWGELSKGGMALMELGSYPFSEKYGWIQDRYGLSWQVMFVGDRAITQKITPTLMFTGDVYGKAQEAMNFYTSLFDDSKVCDVLRYGKDEDPEEEGTVKHAVFTLEGQEFGAMDSALGRELGFSEAISFILNCDTQEEIDRYWAGLSAIPEAELCGWLKDRYGLSWQVVPHILGELLKDPDQFKVEKVMKAMLHMKKINIKTLMLAHES